MPEYTYHCKEHGDFLVSKSMSKASEPEYCIKCGKEAERVWTANIDETMYQRENWRKNVSPGEYGKILNGERDHY